MYENIRKYLLNTNVLLIIILFLGFGFRIWGLNTAETFHDEGLYAFRSIGYIDYLQNNDQSTPIQWFQNITKMPWWTNLSFHDAPPFYFFAQHIFFLVLGDSIFVARLPSLIAGMLAIWLVFLIARRLFSAEISKSRYEQNIAQPDWGEHSKFSAGNYARSANNVYFGIFSLADIAGLLAALLLSINHIHIWISRTSIMESVLITMMLANIYFFLRFCEDKKWWLWFGVTMGLTFLTKYNSIALVPVYAVYLLIFHRQYFRARQLYFASALAIIIFSPVLVYNYYLYQTVNHFDLQISYLFKQSTPEWRASVGKTQEPFVVFVPNILAMYSKPLLAVVLAELALLLLWWKKTTAEHRKASIFAWLGVIFTTLLLVKIGVAFRFLALYVPFFIILAASCFVLIIKNIRVKKLALYAVLALFCAFEIWFAIGGIFLEFPDLGVVKLDKYLSSELGATKSKAIAKSPNQHLDAVIQQYASKLREDIKPKMIIYDENIAISAKLWLFARRLYYHGIPTLTVGQFKNGLRQNGANYFNSYEIYFVRSDENANVVNSDFLYSADANELENFLKKELHLSPTETIYGFQFDENNRYQQVPTFYVYKFIL